MCNDILYLLSHGRGGLWRTSHVLDPVTWTHCIGLWEREEREREREWEGGVNGEKVLKNDVTMEQEW